MAVKIRLARHGSKKHPYYRVVVADGRMPRDGRYIELVGRYNPMSTPKLIDLDIEKIDEWIGKGAQMTGAVEALVTAAKSDAPAPEKKEKLSKKAVERAKKEAEEAAAAAEEAAAAEAAGETEEAPAEAEGEE